MGAMYVGGGGGREKASSGIGHPLEVNADFERNGEKLKNGREWMDLHQRSSLLSVTT